MTTLQFCEYCKYYVKDRPIMFGLGRTQEDCKVRKPVFGAGKENKCTEYKRNKWRVFWNNFIKQPYKIKEM